MEELPDDPIIEKTNLVIRTVSVVLAVAVPLFRLVQTMFRKKK